MRERERESERARERESERARERESERARERESDRDCMRACMHACVRACVHACVSIHIVSGQKGAQHRNSRIRLPCTQVQYVIERKKTPTPAAVL